MFTEVIVIAAISGTLGYGIARAMSFMTLRAKLNDGFRDASAAYFRAAEKLLESKESLPTFVLEALDHGGRAIGDKNAPKVLLAALRASKKRRRTSQEIARREQQLSSLSEDQIKLFAEANRALTHAVMCMSTFYAERIQSLLFEEVMEKPERKVRNAELKIGFDVMDYTRPHLQLVA